MKLHKVSLALVAAAAMAHDASAATETIASTNLNGVRVVESGDSFQVTDNMSIATTAGATGIVTNRGSMTIKDLDLGKYSGGKGALAQFDNFGTLTVENCLRMGILGTPSVFFNHAGATVSKTGGSEYSFYFGVDNYGHSTLVNEGDFFDNSKEIWMGQTGKSVSQNNLIVQGNGRFLVAQNMAIGHVAGSLGTVTLNDNALLSGKGIYRLGGSWQNAKTGAEGRVVLNDNSLFAVSNAIVIGCTGTSKGTIELNDSSKMTATGSEVQLAYGTSSTGSIVMGGNSSFVHETYGKSVLFGYGKTSTGSMTLTNSATALVKGYVYVGNGESSVGNLTLDDSAEFSVERYVYVGVGSKALGTVTLAGDSRLNVTNDMIVGYTNGATGIVNVVENAQLHVNDLYVGQSSVAGTTGFVKLSDSATLVSTNICIPRWGSQGWGTLEVADNSVVTNVHDLRIAYNATSTTGVGQSGTLAMRGGSMFFDIDPENPSYIANGRYNPINLNGYLSTVKGRIRGWGKIAFSDVRTYVTEANIPSGITHYGQVIADGEGVMRDLDFGRFGSLQYANTDANSSGTNGWFAVNKGRLKLPRSRPNMSGYRCVGDCYTSDVALGVGSRRLTNTFNYEFSGAELNNFVFSELYATDREDIPAGLDGLGADKVIAVWRIGYFSDGPEMDEPENPVAFDSARLKFKYSPLGLEGLNFVQVYRHDGTANGRWERCGRLTAPNTAMPVVSSRTFSPSSENWNLGWFAIVGRVERPFGMEIFVR